jgi:hypothetical protein
MLGSRQLLGRKGILSEEDDTDMDRIAADRILTSLHEASYLIDSTLGGMKNSCAQEHFRTCATLLGYVMSDMFDSVMAPIYDEHPDLAPDWYRDGPPRARPEISQLSLSPENRQAMLAAFEAAYEKVQIGLNSLSQNTDPMELVLYSQGFHQISVALCRARMTLLLAETK